MDYTPVRVIISGGGTGGHIFPAISIASKFKELNPDTEILFVGAEGRMEMEKVPAAGFEIVGLKVAGLQRKRTLKNVVQNLKLPFRFVDSIRKARRIIKKFKPEFEMEYEVDPLKQSIADSWPDRLDDSAAREEWDWQPKFDITAMTQDMLEQLSLRMC